MHTESKWYRSPAVLIPAILAAALGWKALLLALNAFPFNADEAVVALMARHILAGERPVFFYGQAYMGSLDAFLVAAGFWIFGQQVWVIRLIQALLYAGLLLTTVELGKEISGTWKMGLLAAGLLAVPTVNVTLYTTASLGGYGEALLIGNLTLWCTLRIANNMRKKRSSGRTWIMWGVWGFLLGLGLWANGLTLIFSLPAGVLLLVSLIRFGKTFKKGQVAGWIAAGLAGFLVGSAPWWIYAAGTNGQNLIAELLGGAVAVEKDPWIARTWNHLVSFILLGGTVTLGLRPPWDIRWLGLPLIPFILAFWAGVAILSNRRAKLDPDILQGRWLMSGVILTLSAGFIFTSFGVDPSGRYFIPLAVPLALAAADAILGLAVKPYWKAAAVVLLIGYQAWGTWDCARLNPPGITTQFDQVAQVDTHYQVELIQFLRAEGETRGYSNYWVAYPTAFLSSEELIFVPRLPYHEDLRYTPRDDRYAPYDALVANSSRTAYITTRNPRLDQAIAAGLKSSGVTWEEKQIGDYRVYYQLSRAVRPQELGLDGLQ